MIGSYWSNMSVHTWYHELIKPEWTPEPEVFPTIWSVLYFMMAYAAWRIWTQKGLGPELALFFVQLFVNLIWSFLFFALKSPMAGFIDIVILGFLICLTMIRFWRLDPTAGFLLSPYLLWVSFAGVLNFYILRLN